MIEHINRKNGLVWPSAEYLSTLVDRTPRSVITARHELVLRDHFELYHQGNGRGHTNQYRPNFPTVDMFKSLKRRSNKDENFTSEKMKANSPDNLEGNRIESFEGNGRSKIRLSNSKPPGSERLSETLRTDLQKRLRENYVDLDIDELVETFLKARFRQQQKGRPTGSLEGGISRYVDASIKTFLVEQKVEPKRSREETIALLLESSSHELKPDKTLR